MKHRITLVILISGISFSALLAQKPAEQVKEIERKHEQVYKRLDSLKQHLGSGKIKFSRKQFYDYRNKRQLVTIDSSGFEYDKTGRLINVNTYEMNKGTGNLVPSFRYKMKYDSQNRNIDTVAENWDSKSWKMSYEIITYWGANHKDSSRLIDKAAELESVSKYFYDGNRLTGCDVFWLGKNGKKDVLAMKYVYTYSDKGIMISSQHQDFDENGHAYNGERVDILTDANDSIVTGYNYFWKETTWATGGLTVYQRDAMSRLALSYELIPSDNPTSSFNYLTKTTYTYYSSGVPRQIVYEKFSETDIKWMQYEKHEFEYNSNNSLESDWTYTSSNSALFALSVITRYGQDLQKKEVYTYQYSTESMKYQYDPILDLTYIYTVGYY